MNNIDFGVVKTVNYTLIGLALTTGNMPSSVVLLASWNGNP
jgi:hypothetical protein